MIQVELPVHLRILAHVEGTIFLDMGQRSEPITQRTLLDALEAHYPMLQGTIRDRLTGRRRPMIRFFAAGEDLSHEEPDAPLPPSLLNGEEPFLIIGALAGG